MYIFDNPNINNVTSDKDHLHATNSRHHNKNWTYLKCTRDMIL